MRGASPQAPRHPPSGAMVRDRAHGVAFAVMHALAAQEADEYLYTEEENYARDLKAWRLVCKAMRLSVDFAVRTLEIDGDPPSTKMGQAMFSGLARFKCRSPFPAFALLGDSFGTLVSLSLGSIPSGGHAVFLPVLQHLTVLGQREDSCVVFDAPSLRMLSCHAPPRFTTGVPKELKRLRIGAWNTAVEEVLPFLAEVSRSIEVLLLENCVFDRPDHFAGLARLSDGFPALKQLQLENLRSGVDGQRDVSWPRSPELTRAKVAYPASAGIRFFFDAADIPQLKTVYVETERDFLGDSYFFDFQTSAAQALLVDLKLSRKRAGGGHKLTKIIDFNAAVNAMRWETLKYVFLYYPGHRARPGRIDLSVLPWPPQLEIVKFISMLDAPYPSE